MMEWLSEDQRLLCLVNRLERGDFWLMKKDAGISKKGWWTYFSICYCPLSVENKGVRITLVCFSESTKVMPFIPGISNHSAQWLSGKLHHYQKNLFPVVYCFYIRAVMALGLKKTLIFISKVKQMDQRKLYQAFEADHCTTTDGTALLCSASWPRKKNNLTWTCWGHPLVFNSPALKTTFLSLCIYYILKPRKL